ncbi:MAG: hypothetical protein ACLT2Z_06485 [Eubacterium sp.]
MLNIGAAYLKNSGVEKGDVVVLKGAQSRIFICSFFNSVNGCSGMSIGKVS